MGLRLLPFMTSVALPERGVGLWPRRYRPWGKHHHGLCGRSVLHPWCGRARSEHAPRATSSGGREAEASFPA
jgi:hypothetical protein